MSRFARRPLAAACCALVLASCARREGPAAPPPLPAPAPPPAVQPRAFSTSDYFALAASLDLFEMRSAELARARSTSPSVREFATMLIADHGGTSAQLSFAGRRLNLLPPATMLAEQQRMFDWLAASGRFDEDFRRLQLEAHRRALELHSRYAARGESPTLRPVAAAAAAVIERHLGWLRSQ